MKNKVKIILIGICFTMVLPCFPLAAGSDLSAYEDVLQQYIQAAESHFDYPVLQNLQYVNEGAANFSGYDEFTVYYGYTDLNEDGTEELLLSIEEPEQLPGSLIDVFTVEDRIPVQRIIGSDGATGYRSRYYVTVDNRIKHVGSSGALNSSITYFRVLQGGDGLFTEKEYIYDGQNGDVYTCMDQSGNRSDISAEEFRSYSQDNDVNYEIAWQVLYDSREEAENFSKEESENNGTVSESPGDSVKDDTISKDLEMPLPEKVEKKEKSEADKPAEDKKSEGNASEEQYLEFLEKHYEDSQMPQYISEGPWYFYNNKLYIPGDRDSYYRIDIYGDSYEKVLLKDDSSEIFVDANILRLSRDISSEDYETEQKKSQAEEAFEYTFPDSTERYLTEAEDSSEDYVDDYELENPEFSVEMEKSLKGSEKDTPQTRDSSDYIIANSASEYLSEAEVRALNLSKKELNYAKYEIYARKGCKFDSSEVQNYFNSKSWYNPSIEAEDFSDDLLNYYEIENLALLAKMERS